MEITRRQFVVGGTTCIGTASLVSFLPFAISSAEAGVVTNQQYSNAFNMLSRISFGATIPECQEIMTKGFPAYVAAQLAPVESADTACNTRLNNATLHIAYQAVKDNPKLANLPTVNEDRKLTALNKPLNQLWALNADNIASQERIRPTQEVRAATWIRATYSKWQLREVMVEFWHNHFNVNAFGSGQTQPLTPHYDAIMRKNCFGNFRNFVEEIGKSPSMLFYLNNTTSKASPANENYARELFELHTLGAENYYNSTYNRWSSVPGAAQGKPIGYIDQDVYEAARAFTGWKVEDGSKVGGGVTLPSTGNFTYYDGWHDNYQKRVLATEFDPNSPPQQDGKKVYDLLSAHPGTAMYICRKLCKRFVGDNPPQSIVTAAAQTWQANITKPDQIAKVLKTILLSNEFATARGTKVKRPFDFISSFLRATAADFTPTQQLFDRTYSAGYLHFQWATPTGHPDNADFWLNSNTMLTCWNLLPDLLSPNFKTAYFNLVGQTPTNIKTSAEIVSYWFMRLNGLSPDSQTLTALIKLMPNPTNPNFVPDLRKNDVKAQLQDTIMTIAMLPEFTVRG